MIKTKNFKKALTILLSLSMLLCLVGSFGSIKANAATDRVSMYLLDPIFSKYGMSSVNIYVKTKDNASNQQVYVHYQYRTDQDWQDKQAEYLMTLSDGSKIWKATISSYSIEYAIKYVADGETIWDNNNGNNYGYELLGTAPITVNRNYYTSYDNFNVNVTLQNYGYNKNVQVRYTENNWATFTDVPLSYKSTNTDGTEIWGTTLSLDSSKSDSFEYCVYYEVNGQTYWANNFGENYNHSHRVYP